MPSDGYAKIEIIDLQPKNGLYLHDIVIEGSAEVNDFVNCEIHYNTAPVAHGANIINYRDFSNISGLHLNGTASITSGGFLRLTDAVANHNTSAGSAFAQLNPAAAHSFSANFQFQITAEGGISDSDGQGGDGFAFVVQTVGSTALGGQGGGMGYVGISPSLSIEFDTFQNSDVGDINGNHVGVNINGDLHSVVSTAESMRFNNGQIWNAWVDYDETNSNLQVSWSSTNSKPSNAQIQSSGINFSQLFGQQTKFVGFTASLGDSWQTHDILNWSYYDNRVNPVHSLETGFFLCQPPILAYAGDNSATMDFGVIRYKWDANINPGGTDLDTKTTLLLPGFSGYSVGFRHAGNGLVEQHNGSQAYGISGVSGEKFLLWAGDDQSATNGKEAILVNIKAIQAYFPSITDIPIQLEAVWFESSGSTANINVEFTSYLGGVMQPIPFDWTPVSGAQIVQINNLPYHVPVIATNADRYVDCGIFHYSTQQRQSFFDLSSGYLGGGTNNIQTALITDSFVNSGVNIDYYEDGALIESNSIWTNSPNVLSISSALSGPLPTGDAAIYSQTTYNKSRLFKFSPTILSESPQKIRAKICPIYNLTGAPSYQTTGLDYFSSVYPHPPEDFTGIVSLTSNEPAWVQYDISSGVQTTNQKFVSFSVSVLNSLAGNSLLPLNNSQPSPSIILPFAKTGISNTCNVFSIHNVAANCNSGDGSLIHCVTGLHITTEEYNEEIKIALAMITGGKANGDSGEIGDSGIASLYSYYTGEIVYNVPSSGDYIVFNSYGSDEQYNTNFRNTFGVTPTYPQISKRWTWNLDYTSVDSLIVKINNDLLNQSAELWVPSPCDTKDIIPNYEYGPLLKASKVGENLIFLESQRYGEVGHYSLQSFSAHSPLTPEVSVQTYLKPSFVNLEGRNSLIEPWTVVNANENIDWSAAAHLSVSGFQNRFNVTDPRTINSAKDDKDKDTSKTGVSGDFEIDIMGTAVVTGLNNCGEISSVDITFYRAPFSGSCLPPDDKNKKDDSTKNDNDPYNDLKGNIGNPMVLADILKTGWKFSNTVSYNYYRVNFSGFSGQAPFTQGTPLLEFYATNIDFYNIAANRESLRGETCLYGNHYSADIQGLASGRMTGVITANIVQSNSGIYEWKKAEIIGQPITGTPKFNFRSAINYDNFTGYLNVSKKGSGIASQEVLGYFYDDPSHNITSFSKTISGIVVGCGTISGGPYNIIDSAVWSGVTKTLTQYVVKNATILVSGVAFDIPYFTSGIDGFGYLQGHLTGYVDHTGSYNFNQTILGIPNTVYQNTPESYINATSILSYHSGITEGDKIIVNGTQLIYTTGTKGPPSYFQAFSGLLNTINSDAGTFGVSGVMSQDSTYATLMAIASGEAGNGITMSSFGSANTPTFDNAATINGVTHYRAMNANTIFSGSVDETVQAVELFTATASSGTVSGYLDIIGENRTFANIWSLKTGAESYKFNEWIVSGLKYQRPNNLPHVIFNNPGNINLSVLYNSSANYLTPDVATLRISGINFSKYIELNITGHQ